MPLALRPAPSLALAPVLALALAGCLAKDPFAYAKKPLTDGSIGQVRVQL